MGPYPSSDPSHNWRRVLLCQFRITVGWPHGSRAALRTVENVGNEGRCETGARPLVIGMDRHLITSELAFYDQLDGDRFKNAGGTHFFGGKGLMWEYWFPSSSQIGRTIILVDLRPERLANRPYHEFFECITDIFTETLEINGRTVGQLYWRIGYGYRGEPPRPITYPIEICRCLQDPSLRVDNQAASPR
jgi:hypothetical protein